MIADSCLCIFNKNTSHNLPYEKVGKNEPVCIVDEVPFEIPDSWEWIRHNTLFEVSGGSQPPKSKFVSTPKNGYVRLYQIRDYGNNPVPVYIPEKSATKTTKKGDILLARYGASLGKVFLAEDGAYNVAMAKVIPLFSGQWINKQYLYLFYHSKLYQDVVVGNSRSAQAGFNKDDLQNLWFPIPPLAEQQRIVDVYMSLEPCLHRFEKTELETNQLNECFPDMLKKSILQQAVMGKLVPQDPSDESASVLLEKIRAEKAALIKAGKLKKDKHESIIYRRDNSHYEKVDGQEVCIDDEIPFTIPESWAWTRACSLGMMVRGKGIKRNETVPVGLPCVRYGEIYTSYNNTFTEAISHIDEKLDKSCLHFHNGDIIFTLTGENKVDIAKAVAYLGSSPIAAGGDLAFWTAHGMNPLYIVFYMASPYCIERKRRTATGDIIVHISTDKVGHFLIPVPPLNEQERIIAALMDAFTKISSL